MAGEFDLTGADLLGPEGLVRADLGVRGDVLAEAGGARKVDLRGYLVLPGIVDLHGDGFERHMAPRRGAVNDLGEGLRAVDAELAANGITTAVLAQFWSWEGGMRGPEFARRFVETVKGAGDILTGLAVQLRLEVNMLEDYDAFSDCVLRHGVEYVVFNDHLPHGHLAAGRTPPRLTGQALKAGRSPEAHAALLKALHARAAEVPGAAAALAARLAAEGVRLGSHDDATAAARRDWRARGCGVAEFPETREAAEEARAGGDAIVLGAPNLVRGGSHKGNVSARDLVAAGLCDALASDYHYPAPRQAAMRLVRDRVLGLAEAWALVSSGPARVLGYADRGTLAPGQRADLVVMEPGTGRIGATICGGRVSWMAGEVAARFMG